MKIAFTTETVRRPSFNTYKHDAKYRHVRVLGTRYSYDSEAHEMTFEKVIINGRAYVIIDNQQLVDLKTIMSMLNCLEIAGSEEIELWTRDFEEKVSKDLDEADEKAKAAKDEAAE